MATLSVLSGNATRILEQLTSDLARLEGGTGSTSFQSANTTDENDA